MKNELKKYIKENLKNEKKKNSTKKRNILLDILLFPIMLITAPFHKIKNRLFEEDAECDDYDLEPQPPKKEDNNKGLVSKIKTPLITDDEENIDENKQTISIEDDVIPLLKEHGIELDRTEKEDINLIDFIKENDKYNDFQTTLFKMIDERNLIDADVYNKVHIDRRLFSKIRNDKNYHPSKETIILLGFSLELTEKEIEKLLDSASYSLPRNNHYDLIIRFCFKKGIYKIRDVNELLEEYNCKLFSY